MSEAAGLLSALAAPSGEPVLAEALLAWLPRQRWYAGKARDLRELHVHDVAVLDSDDAPLLLVLADVRYADGGSERYHVPLAVEPGEAAQADVVARLPEGALVDATSLPAGCLALARLTVAAAERRTTRGALLASAPVTGWEPDPAAPVRRLSGEQSNTSIVVGDAVLKVFRKLEAGENPDVELTRALTSSGVDTVPAQHGALLLREGETTVLTAISELVRDAREGWELAIEEVGLLSEGGPRPHGLLDEVEALGLAVALTHSALADAFGASPTQPEMLEHWATSMSAQARRVLDLAADRAPVEAAAVLDRREDLLSAFGALPELGDAGRLIRVHGDLHLGQVLLGAEGWRLLDFEGEPARPLAERREPHSPLKDVAGMLRSFDYAAAQVAPNGQVENWRVAARRRFLAGYTDTARASGLLPEGRGAAGRLLAVMELDKAVYELGYELANRPDWVRVPVAGILTALDRGTDPAQEW